MAVMSETYNDAVAIMFHIKYVVHIVNKTAREKDVQVR